MLAVGGGSGGHVTPVVAVLREIRRQSKDPVELRFWCDRKFAPQARSIMATFDDTIPVSTILSGKLRRYHHLKWWQHITIASVFWPNVRDVFLVVAGMIQSFFRLIVWRPDVVFTKGGFVCLPVGLAAALLRIPVVIHDSDAHPGLTNRVLSKVATIIATGAPLAYYDYPLSKSFYVGIPIASDFRVFSPEQKKEFRRARGIAIDSPLIVVTGGGLGAKQLNDLVADQLASLQERASVVLVSGREQYDELRRRMPADSDHFQLKAFVSDGMAELLGSADIVVSRAGATTMLELSALAVPTILVPSERLTWQIKHAHMYEEHDAVVLLSESELAKDQALLVRSVDAILTDPARRRQLAASIQTFAKPAAAKEMAQFVLEAAMRRENLVQS